MYTKDRRSMPFVRSMIKDCLTGNQNGRIFEADEQLPSIILIRQNGLIFSLLVG